jgi:hypothetical protein
MIERTWTCDQCYQAIEKAEEGWAEWLYEAGKPGRGLRLVHHNSKCQYRPHHGKSADCDLVRYLTPEGLIDLLALVHEDNLPLPMVVEMVKRLHLPGYEEVRSRINEAIENGFIEPTDHPFGFFMSSDIERLREFKKR